MDSKVKLYLQRAENELLLSKTSFEISTNPKYKEFLNIPGDKTFFNDVISQAYYAIFYSAKAYLLSKGIETLPPEEHKKTYYKFREMVLTGKISRNLAEIYEQETIKAEALLNILFEEKRKRGIFTYNVKSEANIPYANESITNAKTFVSLIKRIVQT